MVDTLCCVRNTALHRLWQPNSPSVRQKVPLSGALSKGEWRTGQPSFLLRRIVSLHELPPLPTVSPRVALFHPAQAWVSQKMFSLVPNEYLLDICVLSWSIKNIEISPTAFIYSG